MLQKQDGLLRRLRLLAMTVWVAIAPYAVMAATDSPPPSLFFSPTETNAINAEANRNDPAALRLDAIVYRDADDWTIWLGGRRITPAQPHGDVRVILVQPDHVQIELVSLTGDAPIKADLRLHQSLDPLTGKVER